MNCSAYRSQGVKQSCEKSICSFISNQANRRTTFIFNRWMIGTILKVFVRQDNLVRSLSYWCPINLIFSKLFYCSVVWTIHITVLNSIKTKTFGGRTSKMAELITRRFFFFVMTVDIIELFSHILFSFLVEFLNLIFCLDEGNIY